MSGEEGGEQAENAPITIRIRDQVRDRRPQLRSVLDAIPIRMSDCGLSARHVLALPVPWSSSYFVQ
jgi:hypothetical protein